MRWGLKPPLTPKVLRAWVKETLDRAVPEKKTEIHTELGQYGWVKHPFWNFQAYNFTHGIFWKKCVTSHPEILLKYVTPLGTFYTKKELTTGNSALSFLDHPWRFHTFSNKPLEILHPITPQLLPRNYLSSTFPVDFFSGTANMVVSATWVIKESANFEEMLNFKNCQT